MRRLAPLAAVAGLAVFAGPAAADVRFEGRTSQGRLALVVAEDNGVPKRAGIRWRAPCGTGRLIQSTVFRMPLDLSTRRRFRDSGTYVSRDRGGVRITVTVGISGRRMGPRRWAGRFRGRGVVRRAGRVLTRCSVRGIRWRVRR